MTLKTNHEYNITFKTAITALILMTSIFFILIWIYKSLFIAFLSTTYFLFPAALLTLIYVLAMNMLGKVKVSQFYKLVIAIFIVLVAVLVMVVIWTLSSGQNVKGSIFFLVKENLWRYIYVIAYFVITIPLSIGIFQKYNREKI